MSGQARWRREREGRGGSYRGVAIEVVRWRTLNADGTPYVSEWGRREWTWNYYLFIAREALPERLLPEFDSPPQSMMLGTREYKLYRAPAVIDGLNWHGGLTLFEKQGGADGMPAAFKAGCDFNHLWDEGNEYSIEYVTSEAMRTVDDLLDAIPDLLVRCGYTAEFCAQSDGFWTRDGDFWSMDGARGLFEYNMERRARAEVVA